MSLYLIPDDANCTSHFNAIDLNNGTAKIGPAWTKVGAVPFNLIDGPVPSVGPFSDANYFTLPTVNPFNPGAFPFTCAMLVKLNSIGGGTAVASGPASSGGFYLNWGSGGPLLGTVSNASSFVQETTNPNAIPTGGPSVMLYGVDATGHIFLQLNGNAVVLASGATITSSASLAYLGRYVTTGISLATGVIFEGLFSTDVPSAAAFTVLYDEIAANIAGLTPTPEEDVANFLWASNIGLTLGKNLFTGAVLPADMDGREGGVPGLAVFVTSTGGPAPMPYMGLVGSAGSEYFHGIQVNTRSAPRQQAQGIELARSIRDTLHRATVPMAGGGSYPFCLVKESQPLYLGADSTYRHRWSSNLDLRSTGLP